MAYADYLVDAKSLHDHLDDPHWRVIDCRFDLSKPGKGYSDYLDGHIPGALYAHLDRDLAGPVNATTGRHPLPDPDLFAGVLGRFGIDRATSVVVYDQGGGAIAARLWWMLLWMGHQSVRVLDGGLGAWLRAGLPLETPAPQVEAVTYAGVPDQDMIVTTAEVEQALRGGSALPIVDARDPERFAGRAEPIDPVAGHLPGARNLPFNKNLTPDGYWRPAAELRQAWDEVLGDEISSAPAAGRGPVAAMCGSGVTACHLVLSAGLAGLPLPRLYVGSWSEWIRDPGRPVASGAEPGGDPSPADGR